MPGLALAYAMNSFTLLTGSDGCTTIVLVTKASIAIGVKSSSPLNGMFGMIDGLIACVLMVPKSSV